MLKNNPRIIIPNFFTSMNMIIGFAVVYFAIAHQFERAAWLVLFSVLMDKMDGTTARMFNAMSSFGVEFDSFSDFFSFGVAPALFYFSFFLDLAHGNVSLVPFYIEAACVIYVLFAAIRLAKFNVIGKDDHEYFSGLTSTQSGAMLAAFFLLSMKYHPAWVKDVDIMSGMLLIHAFLMISNFKYPKLKKRKSRLFNVFQLSVMIGLVVFVIFRVLPEVIYGVSALYVIIGVLYVRFFDTAVPPPPEEEESILDV